MSDFINSQPSLAEQLRNEVAFVLDEAQSITEKIYGQAAIDRALEEAEIEAQIMMALSEEEFEVLERQVDAMTNEEFEEYATRLAAHMESTPQVFQDQLLWKANKVFGTINGYYVNLHDSSPDEIVLAKSPEDTDNDASVGMKQVQKHLVLNGAEVRVINIISGSTEDVPLVRTELPPEQGDETVPQETLERLGRVGMYLAGIGLVIAQNGHKPPANFFIW